MEDRLFLLGVSVALLFAAPLLARLLLKRPTLGGLLDGFVVVSLAGVVAVHVLPETAEHAGGWALLAFAAGLVLPVVLHRIDENARARAATNNIAWLLLAAALFLHGALDGWALAEADALAYAVLLHRIPAGLALWLVLRPRAGVVRTLLVMVAYAGGTAMGALLMPWQNPALDLAHAVPLAALQALVAGSVLHVVVEAPAHGDASARTRAGGVIGALCGVALVWLLAHDGHEAAHGHIDAGTASRALFGGLAPFFLASLGVVGLITAYAPRRFARLLGAPAHVVPALFVTAALFPPWLLALRLVCMALIAVGGRAVVGAVPAEPTVDVRPAGARFMAGVRAALDHTGPWLVVGVLGAALLEPSVESGAVALPIAVAVALAIGAGTPLYLCAAGITPVAAMLAHKGLPLAAVVALMLVGPALSASALAHVGRAHGRRAAMSMFALVVLVSAAAAAVVAALNGRSDLALHQRWQVPWVDLLALGVVTPLMIGSLFRQGVRPFVEQVLTPLHAMEEAHVHGPGCAHEHGQLAPRGAREHKGAARVMLPFDPRSPG